MSNEHPSYYEQIAIHFAEWIAKEEFIMDDEGTWWDISVNKIVAESTAELLQIFKSK